MQSKLFKSISRQNILLLPQIWSADQQCKIVTLSFSIQEENLYTRLHPFTQEDTLLIPKTNENENEIKNE